MECFADDPVRFFRENSLFVHHMPLEQQEELQLEALQQRFAAMRDTIPPLTALADAAEIHALRRIEDVAPLMFPHSLFKSYPSHLLDDLAFPELTEWLSRLTLHNLSAVKGREFEAIDRWMDALDEDTELALLTSSGTTEALSLIPRGKCESALLGSRSVIEWQVPGAAAPVKQISHEASMVWLSYESGRSGMLRSAAMLRENYTSPSTRFLALMPGRASTDWQHYCARVTAAQKRGLPMPPRTAYIVTKEEEAALLFKSYDERITALLTTIRDELTGHPVHMAGGVLLLHRIAAQGLKLGMEPGLAPGSRVSTGGGTKGAAPPPDMLSEIKRFSGVARLYEAYGMTEIGDAFGACEHGRFHVWPWIVPFLFDEGTGALLPRRGRQRGRAGFFDLGATSYWGGLITGDGVWISWGRCPCGRTTPQVLPPISRLNFRENEHDLGCAAPAAVRGALDALNGGLS